jgi:outer membrane protein OmpA-like peptidoglycan-associated protein
MRGYSVLEKLVQKDIPAEYIQIKDFGQDNPWFSNGDWEGRVLNRRVDVVLSPITF